MEGKGTPLAPDGAAMYRFPVDVRTLAPIALLVLVPALARADLSEPLPEWWAVPTPHLDAVVRPDAGLPGQPETAPPIADVAAQGGAYTKVFFSSIPQSASTDRWEWAHRATRFGLETVVGVPGGFAFGIDAIDDQVIHRLEGGDARWEIATPRGGLRLGLGANALQNLSREGEWAWGWSAWFPLLDRTGELEVQTGLRRSRTWRIDAAWASRWLRQKGRRADTLLDTTTLRSEETRWSLRLGGQTRAGATGQVWGGIRLLEDPRDEDDVRSTGLSARIAYAGAQGTMRVRGWDLEGELRGERGEDTLRCGWSGARQAEAVVEHLLAAGQVALDAPWTGSVRPRMEWSGAFVDLSRAEGEGEFPMLPSGATVSGGGSVLRLGAAAVLRVRTRWVDLVPRLGVHRVRVDGVLPQVWSGLWPLAEGSAWLGEVGCGVQWSRGSSRASYRIGWLPVLDGSRGVETGLSHRIEVFQGF